MRKNVPESAREPFLRPFYSWAIIDSNASAFVQIHTKRRVYSDFRYRRVTLIESSNNPSAAGEALAAAQGTRQDSSNTSTETGMSVTVPFEAASFVFSALDRFATAKYRGSSLCAPSEEACKALDPVSFVPSVLNMNELSQADLDRLRAVHLRDCRARRIAALPSSGPPLPTLAGIPRADRNLLRKVIAASPYSIKARSYRVNAQVKQVTDGLQKLCPKAGEAITVWCDICNRWAARLRNAAVKVSLAHSLGIQSHHGGAQKCRTRCLPRAGALFGHWRRPVSEDFLPLVPPPLRTIRPRASNSRRRASSTS